MSLNVFVFNLTEDYRAKYDDDFSYGKDTIMCSAAHYKELARIILDHIKYHRIEIIKTLNLFILTPLFDSNGLAIFPESTTTEESERHIGINFFVFKLITKLNCLIENINCQLIAVKFDLGDEYAVRGRFENIESELKQLNKLIDESGTNVSIKDYYLNFDEHKNRLPSDIHHLKQLLMINKNEFTLPKRMESNLIISNKKSSSSSSSFSPMVEWILE